MAAVEGLYLPAAKAFDVETRKDKTGKLHVCAAASIGFLCAILVVHSLSERGGGFRFVLRTEKAAGGAVSTEVEVHGASEGRTVNARLDVKVEEFGPSPAGPKDLSSDLANNQPRESITIASDGNIIPPGGSVNISANGDMPVLKFSYSGSGVVRQWSLTVSELSHTGVTLCPASASNGRTNPWTTTPTQGGNATVALSLVSGATLSQSFSIIGTQPYPKDVLRYIGGNPWFAKYIAMHETKIDGKRGLRQFWNDGTPLISFDRGVGIMQLTYPIATCEQVWNWKSNVDGGMAHIKQDVIKANAWMAKQRQQAKIDTGRNVPIPDRIEANCVFSDDPRKSSRKFEDAVAIKIYNGASKQYEYCYWDSAKKEWGFVPCNPDGKICYVNRVCHEVPPK